MSCMCGKTKFIDKPIYYEDMVSEVGSGETTLREVFKLILFKLFKEAEGFSAKRAIGDSDWMTELGGSLIVAGFLAGEVSPDLDIEFDWADFDGVINEAIEAL